MPSRSGDSRTPKLVEGCTIRYDSDDRSRGIYQTKVKLPDKKWFSVSLGVSWPGNVNAAKERRDQLRREVARGKLDLCLDWLGKQAAETLKIRLGAEPSADGMAVDSGGPIQSWAVARQRWLESRPKPASVSGKVGVIDRTGDDYRRTTLRFLNWLEQSGHTYGKVLFQRALIEFIKQKGSEGVRPATQMHDLAVMSVWHSWLKKEKQPVGELDRESVKAQFVSEGEHLEPFKLTLALDLATLRRFDEACIMGTGSNVVLAGYALYLLCRGCALRPAEAMQLPWSQIDFDAEMIYLQDTKENNIAKHKAGYVRRDMSRHVPIVFKWAKDGLLRLKSLGARRDQAVCLDTRGNPWKGAGQPSSAFANAMRELGLRRPGYNLKACQKAACLHLEILGFPGPLVADIAGHSYDIHRSHYVPRGRALELSFERDYGDFDVLTRRGEFNKRRYILDK